MVHRNQMVDNLCFDTITIENCPHKYRKCRNPPDSKGISRYLPYTMLLINSKEKHIIEIYTLL